jgi:hypothetical protein
MRHVIGFALAIVMAAAVFFGGGWGYHRLLRVPVVNGAASTLPAGGGSLIHNTNVLYAFAALAGTGLLAGILVAAPRLSPLAAGLPGLALIAWTVVYLTGVQRAVHYIPLRGDSYGAGFEALGFNGVLAAAGFVLIIPLFIPSRWRGYSMYDAGMGTGSSLLSSSPTDWTETTPIAQQQQPPFGD